MHDDSQRLFAHRDRSQHNTCYIFAQATSSVIIVIIIVKLRTGYVDYVRR